MSGKRVLGIAAMVILLFAVAYYAMPNPGKKALQGEEMAMNAVSSWRIESEASVNGKVLLKRTHVAICPDKEHIFEVGREGLAEYIRVGDEIYYRKETLKWTEGTPGPDLFAPFPTPRPCLTNPNEPSTNPPGGEEELKQWIESDIKDGHLVKGEMQDFKGSACREWNLTRITAQNRLGSYNACLRETDHLPVYWRSANERFGMYFQWNPSVTIEKPNVNDTSANFPKKL